MSSASKQTIPHPPIVSAAEWLEQRTALLEREKALTREQDALNAQRRRLPMVKLEKHYEFEGPEGKVSLQDLFAGQPQLIVYHFMFGPTAEKACMGCTGYVNELGDLSLLNKRRTNFVLVSRGQLPKLEAWKAAHGWTVPWYSSFGSDFNFDFHVSFSADSMAQDNTYNYRERTSQSEGELPGVSVFFKLGDDVYHTYSTYERGVENLVHTYALLDVTPYGRQEDFEDSPPGWPQAPTYG